MKVANRKKDTGFSVFMFLYAYFLPDLVAQS